MELAQLTPQQLRRAADIQERILSLQKEMAALLGASEGAPKPATAGQGRISSAGRAAIAAAARARWAKVRSGRNDAARPAKPTRTISAAGRARLAAAARERWKKAKAQGKSTL